MKKSLLLVVMIETFILVGCGSKNTATQEFAADTAAPAQGVYESAPMEEAGNTESMALKSEANITHEVKNVSEGRKLIRNVDMSVETEQFDSLMKKIPEKVEELGGYTENLSTSGTMLSNENKRKQGSIVARIPADQLDSFVEEVEGFSNVYRKNEWVEDVTLQYVDAESRKKSLEIELERLLELMGQAENIESVIAIETRLSEIRYELETYGSQLRVFDNLIEYSTVTINIEEVQRLTPKKEEGAFKRISQGFLTSIDNIGYGLKEGAIGLLIILPYLFGIGIFVGAVILIIVWGVRRTRKKGWSVGALKGKEEKHRGKEGE